MQPRKAPARGHCQAQRHTDWRMCCVPQAGVDVSAMITAWGTWQPALDPNRRPSVSDALIGSLGDSSNGSQVRLRPRCPAAMMLSGDV